MKPVSHILFVTCLEGKNAVLLSIFFNVNLCSLLIKKNTYLAKKNKFFFFNSVGKCNVVIYVWIWMLNKGWSILLDVFCFTFVSNQNLTDFLGDKDCQGESLAWSTMPIIVGGRHP